MMNFKQEDDKTRGMFPCNSHNDIPKDKRQQISALHEVADMISRGLTQVVKDESIHFCTAAPLSILYDQPEEAMGFAYEKLHAWPYANVPTCWRRLYEDASLYKARQLLGEWTQTEHVPPAKRRKVDRQTPDEKLLSQLVAVLDKGAMLSGSPGRRDVFHSIFQYLECLPDVDEEQALPASFATDPPGPLDTDHIIPRVHSPPSFEEFQAHVDHVATPLVIPEILTHWPATKLWQQPEYLLKRTLQGRRLVPVEIGTTYTDSDWKQRVMTFREFLHTYLLNGQAEETGYLAQYDLFAQIPALRNDVAIPDYCFTTPPVPTEDALRETAGLRAASQLEEPLLNTWLGPRGTKTPLHTDPYHNILCQVVGYKYVRLYSPEETPCLYPLDEDEDGVDMRNTSQVDVSQLRPSFSDELADLDGARNVTERFPRIKGANYREALLGPGESLYIPCGWWHYVESLSTSFSVSFWWN